MSDLRGTTVVSLAVELTFLFSGVAMGQQCTLPPAAPFNPYSYTGDSHTYNPYSSKFNAVANVNHEPKKPGEKGHWVSKTYHVSCCSDGGLFKETYATAYVVNESTKSVAPYGTGLLITNGSPSYPIYFGVDGLLNDHLEPKGSKVVHLVRYQPKTGQKQIVVANLYLKYWDDEGGPAPTAATAGQCKTLKEYFDYQDNDSTTADEAGYMRNRSSIQWPQGTVTLTGTWQALTPRYGTLDSPPYGGRDVYQFRNTTASKEAIEECFTDSSNVEECQIHALPPGKSTSEFRDRAATFKVWLENP